MKQLDMEEVADLLWWFRRNGFTQYIGGGSENPSVMVFARVARRYVDLAHVRGEDRTEVARLPNHETANIWTPKFVIWHYYGTVVAALTELRNLVSTDDTSAPTGQYEPPRDSTPFPLTISGDERETMTTRPPIRSHGATSTRGHTR